MRRQCSRCGCYLDPGEWCKCDEEAPEVDQPRRQTAPKRTVLPREHNTEAYIQQKWLEFDMR